MQNNQHQPLPQYAQVDGTRMKFKGLDYSLLTTTVDKPSRQSLTQRLKQLSDKLLPQSPPEKIDPFTQKILHSRDIRPTLSLEQFYLFDFQGKSTPEQFTRRRGKMQSQLLYMQYTSQEIDKFKTLLSKVSKTHSQPTEQENECKPLPMQEQNSQNDIFAEVSDAKCDIEVGRRLNFNIDNDDIFAVNQVKGQIQEEKQAEGKYGFMRKRIKFNQEEEGYEECYHRTGPSLQEMKEYRAQGIQLYQDQYVRTAKVRKVNLNKDYQKIKKIIADKTIK